MQNVEPIPGPGSPDYLHRRANEILFSSHGDVFSSLPMLLDQIIAQKVWVSRQKRFATFGEYALDQSSDGLNINNDQKLWILRCAMDVHGKHMAEWGDVLHEVEKAVRIYASETGRSIRSFNGNSLETLAKNVVTSHHAITYLPSMHKGDGALDGHLIRIRKKSESVYKKVVKGGLSLVEGREAAGLKVQKVTNLGRAQSAFEKMDDDERTTFLAWLREAGWLEKGSTE